MVYTVTKNGLDAERTAVVKDTGTNVEVRALELRELEKDNDRNIFP